MNDKSLFADLEDASEWDGTKPEKPARPSTNPHVENIGGVEIPGFVEDCPKCRGTGVWRGAYSRYGRKCFKCKGTGKLQFKTSPEARARSRASARKRKQRKADETLAEFLEWLDTVPDVRDWIVPACAAGNNWARSMYQGGLKYGALTDNMVTAIRTAIAREADAAEGFEAWAAENEAVANWLVTNADAGNEFAHSVLTKVKRFGSITEGQERAVLKAIARDGADKPSDIDLSTLPLHKTGGGAERSYFAVPDGETRLKLCIRRPGKNSRYHGWTFVDDGAAYGSRRTYGKQSPDGLYRGDVQDQLRAILADPLAASIAYGKLVGSCGVCGRILEDPQSVEAGIGPICASKYE